MAEGIRRVHARRPFQGHHFPVSKAVLLKAESVDELLEKIIAYRAENSLPYGHPEEEMLAHYRKIAPFLITQEAEPIEPVSQQFRRAGEVMRFYSVHPKMLKPGDELVAARRKVCDECPFFEATQQQGELKNSYLRSARRKAIMLTVDAAPLARGWCKLHQQWIALLTMAADPVSALELPQTDERCWIRLP